MKVPRTFAWLALAVLLGVAPGARAADDGLVLDWDGIWSLEDVLYAGNYDIVVADILAVRDSCATNSDPPRVTILVVEVLRGASPLGVRTIRWLPDPLYMPCLTGEAEHIRRWDASPLKGPRPGRRMILGGSTAHSAPDWGCEVFCRWEDSEDRRREVRENVRRWAPEVERRRLNRIEAERQHRESERRWAEVRDSTSRANEARWLEAERALAGAADLRALVARSERIVVGVPDFSPPRHIRRVFMRVVDWLRRADEAGDTASSLELFVGEREDSAASRWAAPPADLAPGPAPGEPVLCIAFLLYAHGPVPYPSTGTVHRLVDGVTGLLLADSATVARVRAAIARETRAPRMPLAGCGAPLTDFANLTLEEAAGVGFKLTPTISLRYADRPQTLVLRCGDRNDRERTDATGWFTPCALATNRYDSDYVGARILRVTPAGMRTLLDSLALLEPVRAGRVSSADSMSLTIRGVRDGEERSFECTLPDTLFDSVARLLAGVFAEPPGYPTPAEVRQDPHRLEPFLNDPGHLLRENLAGWAATFDRRALRFWYPGRAR